MPDQAATPPSPTAGDPSLGRATFTRFLLPFVWEPEGTLCSAAAGRHFRRAKASDWLHPADLAASSLDMQRRRYLTSETDSLLFRHASWFILDDSTGLDACCPKPWRTLMMRSGLAQSRNQERCRQVPAYQVALRPPALILFESTEEGTQRRRHWKLRGRSGGTNLLRNGFLVHEAYFVPNSTEGIPPPCLADVLRFNEIFRFWRCPYPEHQIVCGPELKSIAAGVNVGTADRSENLYSAQWSDILELPVAFSDGSCRRIVPYGSSDAGNPAWMINPDDRAFTMPFVVLQDRSDDAKQDSAAQAAQAYQFENSEFEGTRSAGYWAQILNVDRPSSERWLAEASAFEFEWTNERTYKRWAHYGSLYGYCEHAAAAMVPAASGDNPHGEPPVGLHFASIYFDVTILLLYLRVSVLRFSKRLHEVTRAAVGDGYGVVDGVRTWRKEFHEIRWQFLLLENLYQYPHLSNQQQHLEMYALQRRVMDVTELYQEIDKEVRASDEFVNNELDSERNELAANLSVIATFGLAAALALGWMDAHSESQSGLGYFAALFVVALVFLFVPVPLGGTVSRGLAFLAKSKWRRVAFFVSLLLGLIVTGAFLPRFDPWRDLFRPNPAPSVTSESHGSS